MRFLSWNLHGFVGTDGMFDPVRVAEAVHDMSPAVAAFQEVDLRRHGADILLPLQAAVGTHSVGAQAMGDDDRWYGQLLVSRYPIKEQRIHDLSFKRYEPRRLIEAVLEIGGTTVRVMGAHLGLKRRERHFQFDIIRRVAAADPAMPTILLGDLNEWLPAWRMAPSVLGPDARGSTSMLRTFPSRLPLFPLDRIFVRPGRMLRRVWTCTRARRASDHLPLMAEVMID